VSCRLFIRARLSSEDILPSVGLSVTAAAKALGVSRQMLHDILAERKPLSAVMCLKVPRMFGGSPEVWMRLQAAYDSEGAAKQEGYRTRKGAGAPKHRSHIKRKANVSLRRNNAKITRR
jgi:addiction module HigA family antidote